MYKEYEHTIVITNRALVQGDFFEQMQKVICLHPHAVILRVKEEERRNLRKDFQEISVSCHSMKDMKTAVKNGATQIILGTIFETECKKGLKGKGLEFVREICKACPVPVYAIGGINMERLPHVMDAGAAGGCMMSGFMKM